MIPETADPRPAARRWIRWSSGPAYLAATVTLVYAPGVNAEIEKLVRLRQGGMPEPLPIEPGAILRYDRSRDRRWLDVVLQLPQNQELRIRDLRDPQSFAWLKAEYIRHPLCTGSGARPSRVRMSARFWRRTGARRRPSASTRPRARCESTRSSPMQVRGRIGDGRRLAYQTNDANRVIVTSFPPGAERLQVGTAFRERAEQTPDRERQQPPGDHESGNGIVTFP